MNLSIIQVMHGFQERLLAIALVVLLGLSPLHSALAGIAWSQVQDQSMVDCMHGGDMMMAAGQPTNDREPCCAGQNCAGHACPSGHCTTVGMAIIPGFSFVLTHTVAANIDLAKNSFESRYPPSLFRPPIA